jgi:hypothetical protein
LAGKINMKTMKLYHLWMPPSMNYNLELLKRLTGLNKSEMIRAATDVYCEGKLKEYEALILAMDRVMNQS